MSSQTPAEVVRRILVEQLGVTADCVTPAARFVEDLGVDSLDGRELKMAFEATFGLEIPDQDVKGFVNVGDAIRYFDAILQPLDSVNPRDRPSPRLVPVSPTLEPNAMPTPTSWAEWFADYENYRSSVRIVASEMRLPVDHSDVEDVAQDTAAWLTSSPRASEFSQFHDHDQVRAYLRAVAHNRVCEHWRRRGRGIRGAGWDPESEDPAWPDPEDQTPSPPGLAIARERTLCEQALRAMPEHNHRTAFVLHCLHGLPQKQIASTLGLPESTINNWVHRGKAEFRQEWRRLKSEPDSGPDVEQES